MLAETKIVLIYAWKNERSGDNACNTHNVECGGKEYGMIGDVREVKHFNLDNTCRVKLNPMRIKTLVKF